MAENNSPQFDIDQVRDLLSPYRDGEVTPEERTLVEQALSASPVLRQELERLDQTVTILADLPKVAAPRPFTLTEADVGLAAPKQLGFLGLPRWVLSWATLAAALLCVVAAGGIFWSRQFGSRAPLAAPAAQVAIAPSPTAALKMEIQVTQPAAKEAAIPPTPTAAQAQLAAAPAPQLETAATASPLTEGQVAPPAAADQNAAAGAAAPAATVLATATLPPESTTMSAYAAQPTQAVEENAAAAQAESAEVPPPGPETIGGDEAAPPPEALQQKAATDQADSTAAMAPPAQEAFRPTPSAPEARNAPPLLTATATALSTPTPVAMLTLPVPLTPTAAPPPPPAAPGGLGWLWGAGAIFLVIIVGLIIYLRGKSNPR
jgi:anti-sigma factor RsiW